MRKPSTRRFDVSVLRRAWTDISGRLVGSLRIPGDEKLVRQKDSAKTSIQDADCGAYSTPEWLVGFIERLSARYPDVAEQVSVLGDVAELGALPDAIMPERERGADPARPRP
jgi:hypothetical protein